MSRHESYTRWARLCAIISRLEARVARHNRNGCLSYQYPLTKREEIAIARLQRLYGPRWAAFAQTYGE